MSISSLTLIPFPPEKIGTGKIYRSSLPNPQHLETFKTEYRIHTIVQLCKDEEFRAYFYEVVLTKYEELNFSVLKFPISDFETPKDKEATLAVINQILNTAREGNHTLIHCVGGNGRTGLILALLARKVFGFNGLEAVKWVRQSVPTAVERPEQEAFVSSFPFPPEDNNVLEILPESLDEEDSSSSTLIINLSLSPEKPTEEDPEGSCCGCLLC